jgi:hypothetical protein
MWTDLSDLADKRLSKVVEFVYQFGSLLIASHHLKSMCEPKAASNQNIVNHGGIEDPVSILWNTWEWNCQKP